MIIKSSEKRKTIKIIILFVVLLLVMFIFLICFGMNGLMGNSTTGLICDYGYNLKGNQCIKKEYVDPIIIGDVTLDQKLNNDDLKSIIAYLDNKINLSDRQLLAADVDSNNEVNATDLKSLTEYIYYNNSYNKYNTINNTVYDTYMSTANSDIGKKKICPNSKDNSINYTYDKHMEKCLKTTITAAKKGTIEFQLSYDYSGGTIIATKSAIRNLLENNDQGKLKKRNFYRNDYVFVGWNAYDNSSKEKYCYTNSSKNSGYWDSYCSYGDYIFEDEAVIPSNFPRSNHSITMTAVWDDNLFVSNKFRSAINDQSLYDNDVVSFTNILYKNKKVVGINLLKNNYINKNVSIPYIIQDLKVEGSDNREVFYLSQHVEGVDTISVTKIPNAAPGSEVVVKNIGRCGHGIFDLNMNNLIIACDSNEAKSEGNANQVLNKISLAQSTPLNYTSLKTEKNIDDKEKTIKEIINAVKKRNETAKIDKKNSEIIFRSVFKKEDQGPTLENYYIYNYDINKNKVNDKIYEFSVVRPEIAFQGYSIDNKKLYVLYGITKPYEDINATFVAAYIDVYDYSNTSKSTAKLLKHNILYENYFSGLHSNESTFFEPEGLSILDNNVYIAIAAIKKQTTNGYSFSPFISNSQDKVALIYKIKTSDLY